MGRTLVALVALLAATACSASPDARPTSGEASGPVSVLAASYPLQFVTERVGGAHVDVTNLVRPGADAHSVELSPAEVAAVGEVDLVVHLSGLQAATDDAVAVTRPAHVVDAADVLPESAAGSPDPHLWLDPTLLAEVAELVTDELSDVDPGHADAFAASSEDLVAELTELDTAYAAGLSACRGASLVTSHEAFGHLARRYDLEQVGVAGIDPEVEPSPARLRDVVEVVRGRDVRTLFFETSTSPDVTAALVADLGVDTAVLDPLERTPATGDYVTVMRANLDALTAGLTCGA